MRKQKLFVVLLSTVFVVAVGAQDCKFPIKDDDSLKTAIEAFHDIMAELWHGPIPDGNMDPVRKQISELLSRRDAVMSANLPEEYSDRCAAFSEKAAEFTASVENLAQIVNGESEDSEIKDAFSMMHDAYRAMREALITPREMIEAFHDILQPLWHESYPEKDVEAIKAGIPKLKVRARLIVVFAERANDMDLVKLATVLLEATETLDEAARADDDVAILSAFEVVHDAYHEIGDH